MRCTATATSARRSRAGRSPRSAWSSARAASARCRRWRNSASDNLITRAGDVALKEGRPLVAVLRETPLHLGHLRLAARLSEIGGVVMPPVPAFYTRPETVADIVDDTVGRVLQRLGLPVPGLVEEWPGDVLRD